MADTAFDVRVTEEYRKWYAGIRDIEARARIRTRLRRLSLGNPGQTRPVGEGVSELKIDYGPGYRIYYVKRGKVIYLLLFGGTKKTQQNDIRTALELARLLKE
ncbi:type II toxin-antitoxin system RelE/ParE family toxin [Pseudorhodoplanes sinuspersici]|uniref:Addiction module antitoxin RelB n=1 Tax=Pseudorhodoplanes sinuspersici TaxID=1235591 RepID=A0A1W6ZZ39_9HYPH|nr:type II toxin-antitoxin system RelE/ParE family toxin [Pseudorhodoplanes sinuspersici]ARQ02594.1 addiction module antitoxin RelB [Pseudorhodoplanes sinuspersici]RKE74451.1 putative addiction module killer protein [Pseudorhodoplanes sinuspersici]